MACPKSVSDKYLLTHLLRRGLEFPLSSVPSGTEWNRGYSLGMKVKVILSESSYLKLQETLGTQLLRQVWKEVIVLKVIYLELVK